MWITKDESGKINFAGRAEQLDESGSPQPGQSNVPDNDPELATYLNPPAPPPLVTTAEVLDAMKQIATGAGLTTAQKSKMTALITRMA